MSAEEIVVQPPCVWPEPSVLEGHAVYTGPTPLWPILEKARALFGIVHDVDSRSAELLERLLQSKDEFQFRLLIALYPACATRAEDLRRFHQLQEPYGARAGFRVLPMTSASARTNALCAIPNEGGPVFAVGGTPNLGLPAPSLPDMNVAQHGGAVLLDAFQAWFNWLWTKSGPLVLETTAIPHLVPAAGDPEAASLWHAFVRECHRAQSAHDDFSRRAADGDSGAVGVNAEPGTGNASPTAELGIPPIDPLRREVARIYAEGQLVSIDGGTRIPPLDAPVRPEHFGIERSRQIGAFSRKVAYRISILDERTLRKLATMQKKPGQLLGRLSFPLSYGVRWMPRKAKSLFEAELERINAEARAIIAELLDGDAEAFVKKHRDRVVKDANRMYSEFSQGGTLPDDVIDSILKDLTERLQKADSELFLPRVSYAQVSFGAGRGETSRWESPWGQASVLLKSIAEYPRKVLTDRRFLDGIDVPERDLLGAMNVARDRLLEATGLPWDIIDRARAELGLLKEIDNSDADARAKSDAILLLFKGEQPEAVRKALSPDPPEGDEAAAVPAGRTAEAFGGRPSPAVE